MDWFKLDVSVISDVDYLRISPDVRGHHVALMGFCARRENGGSIAGARAWTDRDWDRAAALQLADIERLVEAQLARWNGDSLRVEHFDLPGQELTQRKRAYGKLGGLRSAASRSALSTAASTPSSTHDTAASSRADCEASRSAGRSPPTRTNVTNERTNERESEARAPAARAVRPLRTAKTAESAAASAEAAAFIEWFNRRLSRSFEVRPEVVQLTRRLLKAGHAQGDMRLVAAHLAEKWANDEKMREFIRPSTVLTLEKFGERLDEARADHPSWAQRAKQIRGGMADGSSLPTVPTSGSDERAGNGASGNGESHPPGPRPISVDGVRGGRVP